MPDAAAHAQEPFIGGMDFVMSDEVTFSDFLTATGSDYRDLQNGFALTTPETTANTVLRFFSN